MNRSSETLIALTFGAVLATGTFGRCNEGTPEAESSTESSAVTSKKTEKTEKTEKTGSPLNNEGSKVNPKHPSIEEARTQVLSKLQVCKSEFADYWGTKADPASTLEILRDAREGYDACIQENMAQEDQSVITAWDVFESIQSYADRCDGDADKCEQLAEEASVKVLECTSFQPKKNENFIWKLDEHGEIDGAGTFPGWQLQYKENGLGGTLSLVIFPGEGGETTYFFNTISEDQQTNGRALGYDTKFDDFCTKLSRFPFIVQ